MLSKDDIFGNSQGTVGLRGSSFGLCIHALFINTSLSPPLPYL